MDENTQALERVPRGKSGWRAIVLYIYFCCMKLTGGKVSATCHVTRQQRPFTALTTVTFYGMGTMVLVRSG